MPEDAHHITLRAPVDGRDPRWVLEMDGVPIRNVMSSNIKTDANGFTVFTVSFMANVNLEPACPT